MLSVMKILLIPGKERGREKERERERERRENERAERQSISVYCLERKKEREMGAATFSLSKLLL